MPFPNQTPRDFNKYTIEELGAGQIGCYGLLRKNTWIYIGRGDLRDRLLDHVNGDNACISRERPTHYVTAITKDAEAWEATLIRELNPICNRRVG